MIVAGLDLSLTATGVAVLRRLENTAIAQVFTSAPHEVIDGDQIRARRNRIAKLAVAIVEAIPTATSLAVIEQPSYGSRGGSAHDRSGLWWLVVNTLAQRQVRVVEVAPRARAKYAAGHGAAEKSEVLVAVRGMFPGVLVNDHNAADALALAAIGARQLGDPVKGDGLTKARAEVLANIRWQ